MVSTVSKKYTKALIASQNDSELQESYVALSNIAEAFKVSKFQDILGSKDVSLEQKISLVSAISATTNAKMSNLIPLLLKRKRVEIVPAMAEEIREFLAAKSGKAEGRVTASFDVGSEELQEIAKVLGSRLQREIVLTFQKTDTSHFNGIKVEIDDLGIEVEINKEVLKKSVIAHILNTTKIF